MSDFSRFGRNGKSAAKATVTHTPKMKGEWTDDKIPVPFNYSELLTKYRSRWAVEAYEDMLPPQGFVTDVVLNTMGVEAPLSYWIWMSLFSISTVLKRDAYLKWGEDILIGNLFVIIVGPPGRVKKTTAINLVEDLCTGYEDHLTNAQTTSSKKINIMRGLATQEALHTQMKQRGQRRRGRLRGETDEEDEENGETPRKSSTDLGEIRNDAVLLLPELTAAISKGKRYLDGVIDKLTSLYDGRKSGEDHITQGRGVEKLQNIHFNMVAGTTLTAIKEELPATALGGGFLSRTIFVYADKTVRSFPLPMHFDGCPTKSDLKERLAWIADNCVGEYQLSPEAMRWYADWYADYHERLDKSGPTYQNVHSRMNTILLRVALLLRCSRYERGNTIDEADVILASVLLDYAYQSSMALIDLLSSNEEFIAKMAVKEALQEHGKLTRAELWKHVERRMDWRTFSSQVVQLYYEDIIRIDDPNPKAHINMDKQQVYVYAGEANEVEDRTKRALDRAKAIHASPEAKARIQDAIAMNLPYGSEENDEHSWVIDPEVE